MTWTDVKYSLHVIPVICPDKTHHNCLQLGITEEANHHLRIYIKITGLSSLIRHNLIQYSARVLSTAIYYFENLRKRHEGKCCHKITRKFSKVSGCFGVFTPSVDTDNLFRRLLHTQRAEKRVLHDLVQVHQTSDWD